MHPFLPRNLVFLGCSIMESSILVSISKEGMARLTLNRPEKRNAMDGYMVKDLLKILQALKDDQTVRVLIIHGTGEHFCAGADIHWMQKMASRSYAENEQDALALAELMHQLYDFPKP